MRKDSITHDEIKKNLIGRMNALNDRYDELMGLYPDHYKLIDIDQMRVAVSIKANYYQYGFYKNKKYCDRLNRLSHYYRVHPISKELIINEGIAGKIIMKLVVFDTGWSYTVAGLIGWLYNFKNGMLL